MDWISYPYTIQDESRNVPSFSYQPYLMGKNYDEYKKQNRLGILDGVYV